MSGPAITPPFSGALNQAGLDRTDAWRDLVDRVMGANGTHGVLSTPLVLGVIYAESRGYPNEASGSLADWFSSFGLMQINAAQHWQSTGRPLSDLLVPETNVDLGTKILASLVHTYSGDVAAAVSAYNGGGRRYPAGTRFCQVWKPGTPSTGRNLDTMCAQAYVTQDGEFGNQPYVDEIMVAANVFNDTGAGGDGSAPPLDENGVPVAEAGMGGSLPAQATLAVAGAALVGAIGWSWLRGHS